MDKIIAIVLLSAFVIAALLILPLNVTALGAPVTVKEEYKVTFDDYITRYAREYDVSEKLVRDIIWCESRGNPNAINKNGDWSTDYGLMQINDYWHFDTMRSMDLNPKIEKDRLKYGIQLLANEGKKHWKASKHCWD